MWPTQEIKKPLQLEAYLCLNYLRVADLNESEAGFSVVHSRHVLFGKKKFKFRCLDLTAPECVYGCVKACLFL